MARCAFFGHRQYIYTLYREKIKELVCELIEEHDVTEFYNGFRGNFDSMCGEVVFELKTKYPFIKNIMVVSYHPRNKVLLPKYFDESIYLLERDVLPKFAISFTNQAIVERVDYIVSGVVYDWGEAWTACEYARKKKKPIFKVITSEDNR